MKNSPPSDQANTEGSGNAPLTISHLSLYGTYSPLEIATLAAGCRGEDLETRFRDALGLLAHAEEMARLGEWGIESMSRTERGDPCGASPDKIKRDKSVQEAQERRIRLAEQLCNQAKRAEGSDKILRNPFLLQIFKAVVEGVKSEGHAGRRYNDWLKYAAVARAEDLTDATMHRPSGPGCWPDDTPETNGRSPATEAEIAEFKKRFESGKPATFHDSEVAKWVAVDLFFWLDFKPTMVVRKTPRSHKTDTEGKIVSTKTNGADRLEKGKFGKKN